MLQTLLCTVGKSVLEAIVNIVVTKILFFTANRFYAGTKKERIIEEIRQWDPLIREISAVLEDAEAQQPGNENIRRWLKDFESLAYDADDKLEELRYEDLRRHVQARIDEGSGVSSLFRSPSSPNNLDVSELEHITTRLRVAIANAQSFNLLRKSTGESSSFCKDRKRRFHGSISPEPKIFGRENEKNEIKEHLSTYEPGDSRIGVIPIVGMGGLGKTTLVQHVYGDAEVAKPFNLMAWVHVSKDYDVVRIMKLILTADDSNSSDEQSTGQIEQKLSNALRDKKFLIVLDDLWNDDYGDWDALSAPLMSGAPGSKIIVTTRSTEVANIVRTVRKCVTLPPLSDEDCWAIFQRHSGIGLTSHSEPWMQDMGRKIARKCKGLPLAAMAMGSLLKGKDSEKDWHDVLNSKQKNLEIMLVLKMSYDDMSSHLKRCFAFCSLFPEDHVFTEDNLVLLWIGEGFVQTEEDNKSREEEGRRLFRDLVSRSLLSPSKFNNLGFVMHDLVMDLAQEVSHGTCCRFGDKDRLFPRIRHLSFERSRFAEVIDNLGSSDSLLEKRPLFLRTLLPVGGGINSARQDTLNALFVKLRYLRVLDLSYYQHTQLPESIGKLILLRHLDLSKSNIQELPSSMKLLYCLKNLILARCEKLLQLPADLWHLINLRYLDVSGCSKLKELPPLIGKMSLFHLDISACSALKELPKGIEDLKDLRKLPDFVVGRGDGLRLQSLQNLKQLEGSLTISKLENVAAEEEARLALLKEKKVEELTLKWTSQGSHEDQSAVLEHLQPHGILNKLSILGYSGLRVPRWLAELSRLSVLNLIGCPNCSSLIMKNPMGSLKELVLEKCPNLRVSLPRLPKLSKLSMVGCKGVDCVMELSLESVECIKLRNIEISSPMFMDKVRLESRNARFLTTEGGSIFSSVCSYEYRKQNIMLSSLSLVKEYANEEDMKVEYLNIMSEPSLEYLPEWVCNSETIKQLKVSNCLDLETLSRGGFPSILSLLSIRNCVKLSSLSSEGKLPSRIKNLFIDKCPKLETISENFQTAIEKLEITSCLSLTSLSPTRDLPKDLQTIVIENCPKLETVAKGNQASVCSLSIEKDCPLLIKNIPGVLDSFCSLKFLSLACCTLDAIIHLFGDGGLCMMNKLEHFCLKECPGVIFFPPKETVVKLPESLTSLKLDSFPDLKSLSLPQALGFIKFLELQNCKQLENFSEQLAQVQKLHVWICPMLERKFSEKNAQLRSTVAAIHNIKVNLQPFKF